LSLFLKSTILDWHVSDEQSLSDHKQICFRVNAERTTKVPTRIPRKTDWRQYTRLIKDSIHDLESFSLNYSEDLDRLADKFKTTILNAYEASCPIVHRKVKNDVPWWEKELEDQRKEVRRLREQ
jgi:hypothetical protein